MMVDMWRVIIIFLPLVLALVSARVFLPLVLALVSARLLVKLLRSSFPFFIFCQSSFAKAFCFGCGSGCSFG